jgi:alginate O-acetyltransferase complex protein AlgI
VVFSSTLFLFAFLPLVLAVYALVPRRGAHAWLLMASLVFYTWGEPKLVWVMLASIAGNFLFGLWIARHRSRAVLALAVVSNLALLAVFKYAGWLAGNLSALGLAVPVPKLAMPLGISFFTFHAMSYVVDVYRGDAEVQRRPLDLALYVTLFPQLVAGPILRYHVVAPQLDMGPEGRRVTLAGVACGVQRFVLGLGKKVLVANTLAVPADKIFDLPATELSLPTAWLGLACYTGQIYFDFSGYSDMAVGLGHLFGFHFPENFQWPYAATSVRDFWRRWHISLSTWFRDYLYIPLGGSRGSDLRTAANLVTVFVLCGLWHGASWTFVAWGLYHGAFLALERTRWARVLDSWPRWLARGCTVLVVMGGWVLFRASSFHQATSFYGGLAGLHGGHDLHPAGQFTSPDVLAALAVAVVFSAPAFDAAVARLRALPWPPPVAALGHLLYLAGLTAVLIGCSVMLAAATHNPFIYFRF